MCGYQLSNVQEGDIFGAVVEAKLQKEDNANRTASISARDNKVRVLCLKDFAQPLKEKTEKWIQTLHLYNIVELPERQEELFVDILC